MGLALAAFGVLPLNAAAQQACGNRETIVARLASNWGESFAGGGLQNATSVFEVWMSAEKGTWTILKTSADGTSCVMASGTNWLVTLPSERIAGVDG